MLKRIALYFAVILGVALVLLGYLWFKMRQERAEMAKSAQKDFSQLTDQKNAFDALGDIDLNASDLDLGKLEEILHKPSEQKRGAHNTTQLGWACGPMHCAITAFFLTPYGHKLSSDTSPASLIVTPPVLGFTHHVGVGDSYLGQSVDEMKMLCVQRGYGASLGFNRITFNKQWNVIWGESKGKINFLLFFDGKAIENWKKLTDSVPGDEIPASLGGAK